VLYPKVGVTPRWPEKASRYGEAQIGTKAKAGDIQGELKATCLKLSGEQGVHREGRFERHEEKYRAVIEEVTP
jgi:hypothetical protein